MGNSSVSTIRARALQSPSSQPAYVALALGCALAQDFATLVALRLLIGIGLGAELALVGSYLAELVPASHRGRMMTRCYMYGMLAVPVAGALATLLARTAVVERSFSQLR